MKSIVKKTLNEIEQLEEKVKTRINKSYIETSDIFSAFNNTSKVNALKVDVQIDEDEGTDAIAEGGEDTVYGQGSNPKPEDETYLNLLKKTTSTKKVKVKSWYRNLISLINIYSKGNINEPVYYTIACKVGR